MHSPLSSCKKPSPLFFHGAFAPSFIWRRRPCIRCLPSVFLTVCSRNALKHISGTTRPIFSNFVRVICGRGSTLFRRRCDMLCTSGFVDDVTFSLNGPYGDTSIPSQRVTSVCRRAQANTFAASYCMVASDLTIRRIRRAKGGEGRGRSLQWAIASSVHVIYGRSSVFLSALRYVMYFRFCRCHYLCIFLAVGTFTHNAEYAYRPTESHLRGGSTYLQLSFLLRDVIPGARATHTRQYL